MCLLICLCVCLLVCLYVCIFVCLYKRTRAVMPHAQSNVRLCVCMQTYVSLQKLASMLVPVDTYTQWYTTTPVWLQHVTIKRVSFDLEPHTFCHYDYVKIYDGTSNSAPLRGTYCGTNFPEHPMSHGRSFFIEFKSDFSVTKPGFTFSVWRSKTYCVLLFPLQG